MNTIILIISILLIVVVLLQSGKAAGTSGFLTGGNTELFQNRKERGGELFMTRLTYTLSFLFIALSIVAGL